MGEQPEGLGIGPCTEEGQGCEDRRSHVIHGEGESPAAPVGQGREREQAEEAAGEVHQASTPGSTPTGWPRARRRFAQTSTGPAPGPRRRCPSRSPARPWPARDPAAPGIARAPGRTARRDRRSFGGMSATSARSTAASSGSPTSGVPDRPRSPGLGLAEARSGSRAPSGPAPGPGGTPIATSPARRRPSRSARPAPRR